MLEKGRVPANKIHLTEETKKLLDQTGRFLIEKRGEISIKVNFSSIIRSI